MHPLLTITFLIGRVIFVAGASIFGPWSIGLIPFLDWGKNEPRPIREIVRFFVGCMAIAVCVMLWFIWKACLCWYRELESTELKRKAEEQGKCPEPRSHDLMVEEGRQWRAQQEAKSEEQKGPQRLDFEEQEKGPERRSHTLMVEEGRQWRAEQEARQWRAEHEARPTPSAPAQDPCTL